MSITYGIAKRATAIDVRVLDANNNGQIEQVSYIQHDCNQIHLCVCSIVGLYLALDGYGISISLAENQ